MGLVACSAPPPACQLPPQLRRRRFVMLVPLGIREYTGTFYLPLEPPKGAIQAFVLANTDFRHPPPPPRHPGPAMTPWGTSEPPRKFWTANFWGPPDPPVGMNETSVIILRRGGAGQKGQAAGPRAHLLHQVPHQNVGPRTPHP